MKPTDKRFWSGEKTGYYPSFKYALSDSVLFSISWTLAISLILCLICLIIGLHNEESISWHTISVGLIFLFIVFIISNGMFLYENWVRQYIIIGKAKRLLPEGCTMKSINFDSVKKEYLKSATKLFSVLLASQRPLITELADKLRLKYPLLPTISPCPTMRLEAIRSIIPISWRRYPKSV